AYCVSSLTFEWGHLMMVLRSDRLALHDILAGTRVVKRGQRAAAAPEPPDDEFDDARREHR
ncbi:MAG: hypothetical protein MUE90_09285, partial [Thermoanaerobaculales bacterium]|nr:hypothetical protein [Thermoanaerobaculales bacterium]